MIGLECFILAWRMGEGKRNWLVTSRNYRTLLAHVQVSAACLLLIISILPFFLLVKVKVTFLASPLVDTCDKAAESGPWFTRGGGGTFKPPNVHLSKHYHLGDTPPPRCKNHDSPTHPPPPLAIA
jgi:hypothetical protein